jgi:anti-anti-sigma factor
MEITRTDADGCTGLTITGRLDGYWANHLESSLTEIVREGNHHLRLNLSGVTFLSSAGIAVLVKFYKRLGAIQGSLIIVAVSAPVRTVLNITRLTSLLTEDVPAAAPQTFVGRAVVRGSLVLQVFDVSPDARLGCHAFGMDGPLEAAAAAPGVPVVCPETRFAIGIGGFDSAEAESRERYGEFLAVAGAAAYQPADGTEVPDYLVASDAHAPELQALRAIACDGAFAQQLRFDVMPSAGVATLSELAEAAVDLASGAVGMVMIAETAGLVGASLRQSPAAAGGGEFFAFPAVRARLTFTAERVFARTLALVAGVAQRGKGPVPAALLRPLDRGGTLLGHFHAAAFTFQPFKKGRVDLAATVRGLFEGGAPLGLLHLLHDDREIAGVGQSEFTRGACWIAPLDSTDQARPLG